MIRMMAMVMEMELSQDCARSMRCDGGRKHHRTSPDISIRQSKGWNQGLPRVRMSSGRTKHNVVVEAVTYPRVEELQLTLRRNSGSTALNAIGDVK